MKTTTLRLLMKLRRPALEEALKELGLCDHAIDELKRAVREDAASLSEEFVRSGAMTAASAAMIGEWADALHKRRHRNEAALRWLSSERARLQDRMRERFGDVKRLDVMAQRLEAQSDQQQLARETQRLDELATLRHAYRHRAWREERD